MNKNRRDLALCVGGLALVLGLACAANANPVERVVARCRVQFDGQSGVFRIGGTVDSVEYFPRAGYAARRDSAQLWVTVDGGTFWTPDSAAVYGRNPQGAPDLDGAGNGLYEWPGRVRAFGFYRERWPVGPESPGDTMLVGQAQGPFLDDDGAFVRVRYAAFAPVEVTAWGACQWRIKDTDTTAVDLGSVLIPAAGDSTRFFFGGTARAGGLRYVLRTLATWSQGPDRWMRLEVSRDTTALNAVL